MSFLDEQLTPALLERKSQHRYRERSILSSPQGVRIQVDNQLYLNFCSNDYLGLANHPDVVAAMQEATARYGVGSGASHLVNGHSHVHHELEQSLAAFTGRERVLLFSTGYMANMGVIAALVGRSDIVFEDRLNHASLIDGGLLSRGQFKRFHHNDCEHLESQLKNTDLSRRKLVVVDGVFSMDGDTAPLTDLAALCKNYNAHLMVDDAHGFGVFGEHGGGCAEYFGLSQNELPILIGTFGKAFGTFGAFVAGSEVLIESLIQFARPYIYTTAMPPAVAAASLASLQILTTDTNRRDNLHARIAQFRAGCESLGLDLMPSLSPIQPIVLGDDVTVLTIADTLKQQGILVGAIRPPTVPEGSGRLRITLSANHSEADIQQLLQALRSSLPAEA